VNDSFVFFIFLFSSKIFFVLENIKRLSFSIFVVLHLILFCEMFIQKLNLIQRFAI